jgi:hypothetical protein
MLLKMRANLDELKSSVWSGAGRLNICLIQLLLHHLEITELRAIQYSEYQWFILRSNYSQPQIAAYLDCPYATAQLD